MIWLLLSISTACPGGLQGPHLLQPATPATDQPLDEPESLQPTTTTATTATTTTTTTLQPLHEPGSSTDTQPGLWPRIWTATAGGWIRPNVRTQEEVPQLQRPHPQLRQTNG